MKIIKDGSAVASCCTGEELSAINAFAKSELRADVSRMMPPSI